MANEDTVYCMDNESFRFLCFLHADEQFTEEEHKNFEQSWTQSVKETERLLKHFDKDVDPHIVGQTAALNEARTLILTLAKPLADMTQIIQDNIAAINGRKDVIKELDEESMHLKKKLTIPITHYKRWYLEYPRTVCTGTNCVEIHKSPISTISETIYKTMYVIFTSLMRSRCSQYRMGSITSSIKYTQFESSSSLKHFSSFQCVE